VIPPSARKIPFILSALAAIITLGVAGYSLFDLTVYHPSTPEAMIPGAASQDLVSLLAASGLLLCILLIRRGREMTWLVWISLLGYLFYAYALYCFEPVYNQLYLFYIAILGLVLYALISFFMAADLSSVRTRSEKQPPRKGAAVLFLLLVAMFAFLWLSTMLPAMSARVPPEASTIFVLDLSFFLPLLTIEAILLFKSKPLGDALSIPILIKIGTLGLSVLLGTLFGPLFGQAIDLPSVGIYALLGIGPLLFVLPFWSRLEIGEAERRQNYAL
jgi:hypothetical protein